MENLQRNLKSLNAEMYDKGKAKRGFETIEYYLNNENFKGLEYLLRDHNEKPVYGQELIQRFEIDTLIEYYNLLFIAVVAGYIPQEFNGQLKSDIKMVLSDPALKMYYKVYYPYKLTEYTLSFTQKTKPVTFNESNFFAATFTDFLSLNRMIQKDKDIEIFKNVLDYVWYDDNVNLQTLIEALSSMEELQVAIVAKEKNDKNRAIWGFFKYTMFIGQFRELLESVDQYKLLQSVLWMYHGYYFDRLNARMNSFFSTVFDNIQNALSEPEFFKNIISEMYNTKMSLGILEVELKAYAEKAVGQSKEDIKYVLQKDWKLPLENFYRDNKL